MPYIPTIHHARACRGHLRLSVRHSQKTSMAGTYPATTPARCRGGFQIAPPCDLLRRVAAPYFGCARTTRRDTRLIRDGNSPEEVGSDALGSAQPLGGCGGACDRLPRPDFEALAPLRARPS